MGRMVTPASLAMALPSFSSCSPERATMQTLTPSRANHCTTERPIPFELPVTSAVRPASFKSILFPSLHHVRWQPERQRWKRNQDDQTNQVGEDERQPASENRREADGLYHPLDHEHVHADRRMNEPKFDRHDDDDAEPDRIEAQLGYD